MKRTQILCNSIYGIGIDRRIREFYVCPFKTKFWNPNNGFDIRGSNFNTKPRKSRKSTRLLIVRIISIKIIF